MTLTLIQRKGKNPMKFVGLLVSMSFVLQIATANAGSCRPLEYAEMKDMSVKDLLATYCHYKDLGSGYLKTYTELLAIYTTHGFHSVLLDDFGASVRECSDMSRKLRTAMKSRSLPENPPCEAPNINK